MREALGRYARVLRTPWVTPILLSALLARFPIGMHGLAIVLFLREETGSYAKAGAVAAAFAAAVGVSGPVLGRLVDRLGRRPVLLPALALHCVGLVLLVVLGSDPATFGLSFAAAVLAGCTIPPLSSIVRTLWPSLLREEPALLGTAFALDGVMVEMAFIGGPLIVAAVAATAGAAAAIVGSVVLVVSGVLWFLLLPPVREAPVVERGHHGVLGALASPGVRTLAVCMVPFGFCFGATEVTLPAFSEEFGAPETAGLLLAVWSAGSAAGGLLYGARQPVMTLPLRDLYVRFAVVLPLGVLPLALATSPWTMALLVLPAGVLIAPLLAAGNQLVGDVAPAGTATEAYTWPITSLVVGIALGNAAAGGLVEAASWRSSFLAAGLVALAGGALAVVRRSTLQAVPRPV